MADQVNPMTIPAAYVTAVRWFVEADVVRFVFGVPAGSAPDEITPQVAVVLPLHLAKDMVDKLPASMKQHEGKIADVKKKAN